MRDLLSIASPRASEQKGWIQASDVNYEETYFSKWAPERAVTSGNTTHDR
jgi:hypothetical protein